MKDRYRKQITIGCLLLAALLAGNVAIAESQQTVRLANTVANTIQVYYVATGHWPASWQDVEQCGLFQVRLVNSEGITVDPDEMENPAAGETVHLAGEDGNGAYLLELYLPESGANPAQMTWRSPWLVEPLETYEVRFRRYDELNEQRGLATRWTPFLADPDRLRQFGIVGLINEAMKLYLLEHGTYPRSMDQLIESGYSPVDRGSINPLSGLPFQYDGSADDILFVPAEEDYYSSSASAVFPVLDNGEPLYAIGSFS